MAHMWVITVVNVDVSTHLDLILSLDATLNLIIILDSNNLNDSTIPHHCANASTSYVTTTTNVYEKMNYLLPTYSTSLTIITSIHSNSMGHKSILLITIHV